MSTEWQAWAAEVRQQVQGRGYGDVDKPLGWLAAALESSACGQSPVEVLTSAAERLPSGDVLDGMAFTVEALALFERRLVYAWVGAEPSGQPDPDDPTRVTTTMAETTKVVHIPLQAVRQVEVHDATDGTARLAVVFRENEGFVAEPVTYADLEDEDLEDLEEASLGMGGFDGEFRPRMLVVGLHGEREFWPAMNEANRFAALLVDSLAGNGRVATAASS